MLPICPTDELDLRSTQPGPRARSTCRYIFRRLTDL